jgi:hypothetical protein
MITHDDGATWTYLPCPEKDLDGDAYNCDPSDFSKKSLHLHGYTERADPRDTYSSPSAIGVMIGVGNVGEHLGLYNEGDTFLTTDGGITWKPVQKGTYLWEYGDQGSVIVLVPKNTATNKLMYTTDEGITWKSHTFDNDGYTTVERITTVPSDNSRNFLLWGKKDGKLTAINLDFSGLTDVRCKLDKDHIEDEDSDYRLWSPKHPGKVEEPECLFGHEPMYYRKIATRNCYNGPLIERLHDRGRNCSCTRQDFEWYVHRCKCKASEADNDSDYNYERRPSDNTCQKIEGLPDRSPESVCKEDSSLMEYYQITGYRKIPLSTCQGGRELEYGGGDPQPCPGHEREFEREHALSPAGLFFAIVVPVGAAILVGYYIYTRWDGKFGRIRLGGDGSAGSGAASGRSAWLAWPIAIAAGVVAVVAATPLLVRSLWRSAAGVFGAPYGTRTYTSRSSFARGRGDYATVENDEGELLGDESDEEV